jgi:acyl-CoA synthetase (AMP-forming)/AMP-acid ligase II
VLHHPLDVAVLLAQIRRERITYTVAPPALLTMLLMKPEMVANADLSSIENIGSGSASLSPWMVAEWQEKFGICVVNMFGSNEGASLTSGPKEFSDPADRAQCFPRFGSPGYEWSSRIGAQMSSKLVDPSTGAVITQPGVPGEMAIKSPGIFPGYYKRPDLTDEVFDDEGYFYTGDLFEIAGDGEKLDRYRFVSRLKDIIVRGGFKISPEDIEALVMGHPGIAEAAVVSYPDRRLGEKVCLVAVPREGRTVTLEEIIEHLERQDIAAYKLPEKLLIVERLPRNPLGKVLKGELRERVAREGV